jgi:hypothetical protein
MKSVIFRTMMTCILLVYRRFEESAAKVEQAEKQGRWRYILLKNVVDFYQTPRLYNPEDRTLHSYRCENLQYHLD